MAEGQYVESTETNHVGVEPLQRLLAVLEALKRVGDGTELSKVQTLAGIVVRTEKDRQLQQAAQECLPYLEARAVERKQSQRSASLRAQETAAPEILLRPASQAQPKRCRAASASAFALRSRYSDANSSWATVSRMVGAAR